MSTIPTRYPVYTTWSTVVSTALYSWGKDARYARSQPPWPICLLLPAPAHEQGWAGLSPATQGSTDSFHSKSMLVTLWSLFFVFFVFCFSSEVGSGQPFRESDLESFFVYTLASFYWKQINCSQKATHMEEKWGSGKEFGLVNFSIIEIELIISNNSFWLIWSIYTTMTPLWKLIVQWVFTFDFRIWSVISIFNYCYELVVIASLPLLLTLAVSSDVRNLGKNKTFGNNMTSCT